MRTTYFLFLFLASFLLIQSSTAQIKFRKVIGSTGYDNGASAQQTLDKGYILAGSTSSFGAGSTDVYLVKTDSFGVPMLDRTFGGINIDRGTYIISTSAKTICIT